MRNLEKEGLSSLVKYKYFRTLILEYTGESIFLTFCSHFLMLSVNSITEGKRVSRLLIL